MKVKVNTDLDPNTGLVGKVNNRNLKVKVKADLPKVDPKTQPLKTITPSVGVSKSQYNVNLPQDAFYNPAKLESTRASNQPWSHEAANALVRFGGEIGGGAIEGFGVLGELLKGNKLALDTENVLINLGRDIKESANENFKIYNSDPGGFMFGSTENFFENVISLGSSLSMLIPVAGSFRLLGGLGKLAKGMSIGRQALGALQKAGSLTKYQKWVANGLSQSIVSRHLESNFESFGTYESLLQQGLSKEQAEAAALDVYSKNWVMLLQDIPQYLAFGKVYNAISGKLVKNATKVGSKVNPKYAKALGLAGVSAMEAGEEAFQYVVAQEAEYGAKLQAGLIDYKSASERTDEYFSDPNFWNSMIMGAAGGAIFQSVMPKLQGGNKTDNEKIEKQYLAARGGIFKNLTEMIDQADQTNDEAAQLRIRRKANSLLIQNALLNDRYEEHLEWLDTLENLTPEEKQQLEQEERITLSSNITSKVIPQLRKESEAIKNEFLKHVNKHGVNKASLIALNSVDLQNQKEYVQQAYDNFEKVKKDVLSDETGKNVLDPISQEFFDLTLDENAYAIAKAIKLTNIDNNPNFSKKQKEIESEKVEKNYSKTKKDIDKKRKEIASRDNRTSEQVDSSKELFRNLNNRTEETKERELVKFRARHLAQKEQLKTLEKEKAYLNSSQYEFDKTTSGNLNEINKTNDLNNLRELGTNLEKNGQLNTIINEYRQKEKALSEQLDNDLQRIAEVVYEKAKLNGTKPNYEVGSLSKEDRYIVDRYKKQFNDIVRSLNNKNKPKEETSTTVTTNSGTEVNRGLDISFLVPNDARSSELNNYVDWLIQPVNYEGYTAVITRSTNQQDQYEYRVTFRDTKGNDVIHKGKEVFTWLSTTKEANKNKKLNSFKESINDNLDSNNQVFVKVKKQEVPAILNSNNNNDIYKVFGENPDLVYTNADGDFVPFGKKSKDEVGKVVRGRLGTKTRRPGLIYIITKDINGEEIPIKLNTPLLGEVKNAAEVIYEIYKVQLLKGVEQMSANVPQKLLDMLPFDTTHFTNEKGEVTYTELLDQLVYDSKNTRGTSSSLTSYSKKVLFGNNEKHYYKDGENIKVSDVLLPRDSRIKEGDTLIYVKKDNKDHVQIHGTDTVIEARLRKGHSFELNAENINDEKVKAQFIDFINTKKRFNIKVVKSQKYLDTLVSEKLLSTDKEPGAIFEPIVDYNSKGIMFVDPFQLSKKSIVLKESTKTDIQDNSLQSNEPGIDNSNANGDFKFDDSNTSENVIEESMTLDEIFDENSDKQNFDNNHNKIDSQTLANKNKDMLDSVKNVDDVSTQEYSDFINTGVVSEKTLNRIAEKDKNNEALTRKEKEIFNKKLKKESTSKPISELEKPYKTANDGSGKMVKVTVETVEKDGIKKTTFKTQTTNKQGDPKTQDRKTYNTFEEAVENLGIDLQGEANETALDLVETLKKTQEKENLPTVVLEIRESTDKSSVFYGKRIATVVVGGEKIDFKLKDNNKPDTKSSNQSEIEAQKADIERRKKEELKYENTQPTEFKHIGKTFKGEKNNYLTGFLTLSEKDGLYYGSFNNEGRNVLRSLNAPDSFLYNHFKEGEALNQKAKKIITTKPVILRKDGNEFTIISKGEIYYDTIKDNNNPKANSDKSGTKYDAALNNEKPTSTLEVESMFSNNLRTKKDSEAVNNKPKDKTMADILREKKAAKEAKKNNNQSNKDC